MKQYRTFWLLLTLMMVGSFTLTSCVDNQDNPSGGGGGGDKDKNYVERLVPVVDPQENVLGTVMLRFYNDMPNVAYINVSRFNVSRFQEMMYPGTTIQVQSYGNSKYTLTNPCGTAKVDTDQDLFMSDNYEAFTNMMGMVQPGMPNTTYDALPIIRWKSLEASPAQVTVTLDYGKYNIDIREDGENVYFPFATIADLYTDGYMHIAAFNGQSDMAEFSYKNLCFTMTNFFGYPGRTLLEKSMKEKGMDQALQDYGKAGEMTRELLQSTDMFDYISGTATLGCLLNDGGHTYTDVTVISDITGNADFVEKLKPIYATKLNEFLGYCPEYQPINDKRNARVNIRNQLNTKRKEKFGKGVHYVKVGNTVYCQFDSFLCDDSGWRKFYKGEGPRPTIDKFPNDWLVIIIDALEKAQNDPEVKNFIVDISTNGGGSSDVVVFLSSLFCNKPDIYYENTLTGQKMKCTYEVDRNLDGKFDEKDKDVKINLNVGVLTSNYSFSCANMFPAMMKDYGIALIGQQSGGGSCCVLFNPSAEGFGYRYSTHRARLINLKGENIDEGIKPDYQLENPDEFFDIAKVGKLIEQFYAK